MNPNPGFSIWRISSSAAHFPSSSSGGSTVSSSCGRNAVSGLPMTLTVHTAELIPPLREVASSIAEGACRVLENTPAEMAADILQDGIMLCGGGALLRGLDEFLVQKCHAPAQIAAAPTACTAEGLAKMLSYKGDIETLFRLQGRQKA